MNSRLALRTGERMVAMGSLPKGGEGVDSERELMLEDARSISERLWRMAQLAQQAAELGACNSAIGRFTCKSSLSIARIRFARFRALRAILANL
jgi:hypothetical protein